MQPLGSLSMRPILELAILVLEKKQNNQCSAFNQRRLSSPKSRYSVYNHELLAISAIIWRFRLLRVGRQQAANIVVYSADKTLPRQLGLLSYISPSTTDFRLILGSSNVVSDAHSMVKRLKCLYSSMKTPWKQSLDTEL